MTDKLCFRCDWQGATTAKRCPSCAEPLFGPGVPPRPSSSRPGPTQPTAPTESAHRSHPLVAFVVVALVLATSVGAWLDAHRALPATPASALHLRGTLVYAVPDGANRSRLWSWDLASGTVVRGPRVERTIGLVDASGAGPDWVGLTAELAGGRVQASVVRSLDPSASSEPILTGDLVSWGPRGDSVVAVRRGILGPGCSRRVSIVLADIVPSVRERQYFDPALCGDVLSVGLGEASTIFTLEREWRTGIFLAGFHRIHPVLAGEALVGMSAVNDMIVVPEPSLGFAPLAARPDEAHASLRDAGLFFQGQRTPDVTSYGLGSERFSIEEVLAWSPDALEAFVVGQLGDRRGVYELDAGPVQGERAPRYVGPATGTTYATFALDGTAILATGDGLFAFRGGGLIRLRPPTEAPAPFGPIVWIR